MIINFEAIYNKPTLADTNPALKHMPVQCTRDTIRKGADPGQIDQVD
jgi:hypothetical protein